MPALPESSALTGLSDAEAAARLQRDGYNELPSARPRSIVAIALEVVREPMFLLLIASGVIYLLLGDPAEAAALLAAVFLVIGITLYQEQKTERALQALRDLSSPRALVVRDGVTKRIAGRDVVHRARALSSSLRARGCAARRVMRDRASPRGRPATARDSTTPATAVAPRS